jgi:hypothetical protein
MRREPTLLDSPPTVPPGEGGETVGHECELAGRPAQRWTGAVRPMQVCRPPAPPTNVDAEVGVTTAPREVVEHVDSGLVG